MSANYTPHGWVDDGPPALSAATLGEVESGIEAVDQAAIDGLAGKVPSTRTVNGKPLSADVTLTAADVEADASGAAAAAQTAAIAAANAAIATQAETDSATYVASTDGSNFTWNGQPVSLGGSGGGNVDGGTPTSTYTSSQALDGGTP